MKLMGSWGSKHYFFNKFLYKPEFLGHFGASKYSLHHHERGKQPMGDFRIIYTHPKCDVWIDSQKIHGVWEHSPSGFISLA